MAVKKAGMIVSHFPKSISRVCSQFLLGVGGGGGVIFSVLYQDVEGTPLILFKED